MFEILRQLISVRIEGNYTTIAKVTLKTNDIIAPTNAQHLRALPKASLVAHLVAPQCNCGCIIDWTYNFGFLCLSTITIGILVDLPWEHAKTLLCTLVHTIDITQIILQLDMSLQ